MNWDSYNKDNLPITIDSLKLIYENLVLNHDKRKERMLLKYINENFYVYNRAKFKSNKLFDQPLVTIEPVTIIKKECKSITYGINVQNELIKVFGFNKPFVYDTIICWLKKDNGLNDNEIKEVWENSLERSFKNTIEMMRQNILLFGCTKPYEFIINDQA